jgi:hypothetical protein
MIVIWISDFDDSFGSKSHGSELAFSFPFYETSKEMTGGKGISLYFLLLLCLLLYLIREGI